MMLAFKNVVEAVYCEDFKINFGILILREKSFLFYHYH